MLTKVKIALIAALVASTASAALARPTHLQIPSNQFGPVLTDEGQGRFASADGSGP
jgi:hypothetical protein